MLHDDSDTEWRLLESKIVHVSVKIPYRILGKNFAKELESLVERYFEEDDRKEYIVMRVYRTEHLETRINANNECVSRLRVALLCFHPRKGYVYDMTVTDTSAPRFDVASVHGFKVSIPKMETAAVGSRVRVAVDGIKNYRNGIIGLGHAL